MSVTRLGRLRDYQGQKSLDEWAKTELRQNFKAIEEALNKSTIFVEYRGTGAEAIAADANSSPIFKIKVKDDRSLASVVDGVWIFTAPFDGVFAIATMLRPSAISTTLTYALVVQVNGENQKFLSVLRNNSAGDDNIPLIGATDIFLSKGERLSVAVRANNATNFTTDETLNWVTISG